MATNPIVSLPNADRAREALAKCEFVVVTDCVAATETTALAHVLLPGLGWGEKDGTVTNSDRRISRQRGFLPAVGEARADWRIISEVARRMGHGSGFPYESAQQVFAEHAALSALGNDGRRAFDIGALAALDAAGYDRLEPVQWPVKAAAGGADGPVQGTARLFTDGRFFHRDGRARLVAVRPRTPRYPCDEEYPLVLNTGRIRDQWHTMTRTGRVPRLSTHLPEPFVDLHAADALCFGLKEGTLVRVVTRWGRLVGRLRTSGEVARGQAFVPIHWSGPQASDARVGALMGPAVDPVSGEPEYKHTPARVEPFGVNWYGFILSRHPIDAAALTWWSCAEREACRHYEVAGRGVPGNWTASARKLLGAPSGGDWLDYEDAGGLTYRCAWLEHERLEACLFVSPRPDLPVREWIASLFDRERLSPEERGRLLAGRPADAAADTGPTVCACFSVGRRTITAAIARGCRDSAALGREVRAGTGCGSCVPELRTLIREAAAEAASEAEATV